MKRIARLAVLSLLALGQAACVTYYRWESQPAAITVFRIPNHAPLAGAHVEVGCVDDTSFFLVSPPSPDRVRGTTSPSGVVALAVCSVNRSSASTTISLYDEPNGTWLAWRHLFYEEVLTGGEFLMSNSHVGSEPKFAITLELLGSSD
jgi:hypothetical protein